MDYYVPFAMVVTYVCVIIFVMAVLLGYVDAKDARNRINAFCAIPSIQWVESPSPSPSPPASHHDRLLTLGLSVHFVALLVRAYPPEKLALLQCYTDAHDIATTLHARERAQLREIFFGKEEGNEAPGLCSSCSCCSRVIA